MKSIPVIIAPALLASLCWGANIVEGPPNNNTDFGMGQPFKEYEVQLKRPDGGTDQGLKYRLYRYGAVGQNMPLLVQVHEWGGNFTRMESITYYEKTGIPFVMLAFQFTNADDNTYNWWYGQINKATNELLPYAHNAVIDIVRKTMTTDLVKTATECTIDTNRIYIFGHSIGGTGAVQIGMRHPEIFAAVNAHAGWTRFSDVDRAGGKSNAYRSAYNTIIGTVAGADPGANPMPDQSNITIKKNSDMPHLTVGSAVPAYQYTDLNWYFRNVRDASWPTPFLLIVNGASDDPAHQGDNLQPVLEEQKRGYTYSRAEGGHTAGGVHVRMERLYKFRKDQSFLAFTNRKYGLNSLTATGMMNDIADHGWDPATIIDNAEGYSVKLTGKGVSDVTLQRLQKLKHTPGTSYKVKINGADAGQVVADQYGLLTIPNVTDAATLELGSPGTSNLPVNRKSKAGSHGKLNLKGYPELIPYGAKIFSTAGRRILPGTNSSGGSSQPAAGMLLTP